MRRWKRPWRSGYRTVSGRPYTLRPHPESRRLGCTARRFPGRRRRGWSACRGTHRPLYRCCKRKRIEECPVHHRISLVMFENGGFSSSSKHTESHELLSAIPPQITGQVFRSARHQEAMNRPRVSQLTTGVTGDFNNEPLSVEGTRARLKPAGKV